MLTLRYVGFVLGFLCSLTDLAAHAVETIIVRATLSSNFVEAVIKVGALDASTLALGSNRDSDQVLSREEFAASRFELAAAVAKHFRVLAGQELLSPASVSVNVASTIANTSDPLELQVRLQYLPPGDFRFTRVTLDPNIFRGETTAPGTLLNKMGMPILGHTSILTVTDCGTDRIVVSTGSELYQTTLTPDCPPAALGITDTFLLAAQTTATTGTAVMDGSTLDEKPDAEAKSGRSSSLGSLFGFFLKQGLLHILEGWDHIFFVIGLVVVAGSLMNLVKVITAFTIAHSITLIITAADFVSVNQPTAVEAIIALSIAYVGAENLIRRGKPASWRWIIAFMFGLVHGMGFAGALRENIGSEIPGSSGLLLACLLIFNLGVEIGQLLIIIVLYPALQWLRKHSPKIAVTTVFAASILVLFMGMSWFLDRTWVPGIPWAF